jgi:hypothetical protein
MITSISYMHLLSFNKIIILPKICYLETIIYDNIDLVIYKKIYLIINNFMNLQIHLLHRYFYQKSNYFLIYFLLN